jgi:hypothetical protein
MIKKITTLAVTSSSTSQLHPPNQEGTLLEHCTNCTPTSPPLPLTLRLTFYWCYFLLHGYSPLPTAPGTRSASRIVSSPLDSTCASTPRGGGSCLFYKYKGRNYRCIVVKEGRGTSKWGRALCIGGERQRQRQRAASGERRTALVRRWSTTCW